MPGLAPQMAAWKRRMANLPGPVRPSGPASNGEPVTVELFVGEWVDITEGGYVLVRDNSGNIRITYGINGGEGSQTDRANGALQLKNTDGRFSRRNPTGEWYGKFDRNNQVRISVPDGNGGISYRLWGELGEVAKDWDTSGQDVWVDASVYGPLQRLAQGPAPERSVIYRAITDPILAGTVAYWSCEDPTGSRQLASALINGSPMTFTGVPALASYEGFGASDPLPTLTGAALSGGVARYDTTTVTQYQVRYLLGVPAAGFSDLDVLSRISVEQGAYNLRYLDIHYNDPPGGVGSYGGRGTLTILLHDGDENILATSGTNSLTLDARGRNLRVSLEVSNNGSALAVTLRILDVDTGVTDSTTVGLVSTQVTRVTSIGMAPDTLDGDAGVIAAAVGHVLVQTTITDIEDLGRAIQPTGEAAGRRMQRLCAEEGVVFDWIGDLDDTVPLGPQGKQNLLSLVQEACLADGGLLYENRAALGLGYRTRASLYNQDPQLTLSYTGHNLSEVPVPVEDDRPTQNVLTVTVGGVSQTFEETEGPLGTGKIGRYGETSGLTLNLATSDAANLLDHAAWRVHLGTVDEDRYPKVSVNLAHPSITPELKRAILGLRIGDRIQITTPPSPQVPPDTIDQLALGMEETLTHFEHRLTFICAPSSPYNTIGVVDDPDSRIDIDGSVLSSAISSSATSVTVQPSPGESMLWTTDSADWPFDVRAGGEVMRVTAVADWLSDTFTRSASSSWGTADTGQVWSVAGGSASDYSVGSGVGVHTLTTVTTTRRSFTASEHVDFDYYVDVTTSATATGGSLFGGPTGRYIDSSNLYMARLEFDTANVVTLTLRKIVDGSESVLATQAMDFTYTPTGFVRVRFQAVGPVFKAKCWLPGNGAEPDWAITATDISISETDFVGTRSFAAAANSNVNPAVSYDNLRIARPQTLTVTRSINGVTKAHAAGTDIRLAYPTYVGL